MACKFEILLSGDREDYLTEVAKLALDEIDLLDEQLNCFARTSELSYLNAEAARGPVVVDPALFGVLELSEQVWRDTDGAFDVTAGILIDLWREAESTGAEPDGVAITAAIEGVGMPRVFLDPETNSVGFARDGMRVNLGGIGKGFAVGRAASVLREYGVESALVHGGRSTVYAIGAPPGADSWRIGIRHPRNAGEYVTTVELRDAALSTSGGLQQRGEGEQERFEHIIDPVSGMPGCSGVVSASVITGSAALADALSTAFYLRGRALAESYCSCHGGTRAVIVEGDASAGALSITDLRS